MRKNNVLIKKNTIINFGFYKFFLFSLKKKFFYLRNIYFDKNKYFNFVFLFPTFFFSKKIFHLFNISKSFFYNNNISYIFLKNQKNNLNFNKIDGNNIILYNKNKEAFDLKLINNEDNFYLFSYKNFYACDELSNLFSLNEFNFFINLNLYFLNLTEIYKIIIIVYLNNINKNK